MDYRALLIKYMTHVGQCEGINFVSDTWYPRYRSDSADMFSGEEWAELEQISEEIRLSD